MSCWRRGAHRFDRVLAAAAALDEDPRTTARLTVSAGRPLLEIAAPAT